MKAIVLNDGMSVIRARLERDVARFSLMSMIQELNDSPHFNIWIWDGPGAKKKRREIFPTYKDGRKPASPSIFTGMMLIRDLLMHANGLSIEVPGYEADDVIATLAKKYAGKAPVAIVTRDYDLRACCAHSPTVTCTVNAKPGVPDELIQHYKVWVGDPSDNVPGVKGFGLKAWETADKKEIVDFTRHVVEDTDSIRAMQTIPNKFVDWVHENEAQFRAMWGVLSFYDVPNELMSKHTVVGKPDMAAVDAKLKEFFL